MAIFNMVGGGGGGGGGGYKTYNQLKAMSLSDALIELNTDAQGYYDNLNDNGHIIGIGIANNDNTTYQCWGVSQIIYWNGSWRNGEIIIVKIKTDSSGNLKIPKAGYGTGGSQNASYNWRVSYDNGTETQYSGKGSAGSITIASGLTADTEHTIVIRPNSESGLWARAFGFRNSGVQTLLTEIIYDGSYIGYSNSATIVQYYFRYYQYYGCTNLTKTTQEVLPSSIIRIRNGFRQYQYAGCTHLTEAAVEILPSSVTTIENSFRYNQYYNCSRLISTAVEVLPNSVTSIGTNFRYGQYLNCSLLVEVKGWKDLNIGNTGYRDGQYSGCTSNKIIRVLGDVGYSAVDTSVLDNNYVAIVLVPSTYLQNYIDATTYPRSGITDSKFVGY